MNDEEKTVEPARLGKEAKIGVAVILALVLIFAAVVGVRLFGSSPNDGLAVAADHNPGNAERPAGDRHEKHFPKAPEPKPRGERPATLVVAKPDPPRPPKPLDNDSDKWKLASDKDKAKPAPSNEPALISPPPAPPETLKPLSANRYERKSSDPMSGFNFNDSASAQPSQPPAGPGRKASDEKPRHRSDRDENPPDRAESSGYTSIESPPSPPRREHGRYDDSTPLPPREPSRPDRSYDDAPARSTPAAPISRPDASDYSRRSPPPMYEDDAPRRRGGSRSYDAPPPLRDDGKYEVQPLDNFWTISEKLYGTGAYFKALAEHNRDKVDDEGQLQPGALVLVPTVEQLEKSYPDLCPKSSRRETLQNRATNVGMNRHGRSGRTYTVAEGDTLFDIARYELGKASRWVEIYELNRDVLGKDFNYITPGTKLALPDSGRPDVLAEPPSTGYRR